MKSASFAASVRHRPWLAKVVAPGSCLNVERALKRFIREESLPAGGKGCPDGKAKESVEYKAKYLW
jgi:hypothetical protein